MANIDHLQSGDTSQNTELEVRVEEAAERWRRGESSTVSDGTVKPRESESQASEEDARRMLRRVRPEILFRPEDSDVHDVPATRQTEDVIVEGVRERPVTCPLCRCVMATTYELKKHIALKHLPRQRPIPSASLWPSYRLLVTILCTCSLTISFASQSSMGAAMVSMTHIPPAPGQPATNTSNIPCSSTLASCKPTLLNWSNTAKGWIQLSFFIGYYLAQLPAGYLATRLGGRRYVMLGLFCSSVGQLMTPPLAAAGVLALCVVRALTGVTTGFIYAPVYAIMGNWVPPAESSLLFGITGSGRHIGTLIPFALLPLGCYFKSSVKNSPKASDIFLGWAFPFYVVALLGFVMTPVFAYLVPDSPSDADKATVLERVSLTRAVVRGGSHGDRRKTDHSPPTEVPVLSIVTSVPVWAIAASQLGSEWLYQQLLASQDWFMRDTLNLDKNMRTVLSGAPLLLMVPSLAVAGLLCDRIKKNWTLSRTHTRKLADFIGKLLTGCLIVGFRFMHPSYEMIHVILFLAAIFLSAFSQVTWLANPANLAPPYTGFVASVCVTGVQWTSVVIPVIIEKMTYDRTPSQYSSAASLAGFIQLVTWLVYILMGSAELQPWGRPATAPPRTSTTTRKHTAKRSTATASKTRSDESDTGRERYGTRVIRDGNGASKECETGRE